MEQPQWMHIFLETISKCDRPKPMLPALGFYWNNVVCHCCARVGGRFAWIWTLRGCPVLGGCAAAIWQQGDAQPPSCCCSGTGSDNGYGSPRHCWAGNGGSRAQGRETHSGRVCSHCWALSQDCHQEGALEGWWWPGGPCKGCPAAGGKRRWSQEHQQGHRVGHATRGGNFSLAVKAADRHIFKTLLGGIRTFL